MLNLEAVKASGTIREGQLWLVAKCPSCGLNTILILDRQLRIVEKHECAHFVSLERDETKAQFKYTV